MILLVRFLQSTLEDTWHRQGHAWFINSAGAFEIITEANYNKFNIKYGNQFALPVPMLRADFHEDINDAESVGLWTVETTASPEFWYGGFNISNNGLKFFGPTFNIPTTVVVVVTTDEVDVVMRTSNEDSFSFPDGLDLKDYIDNKLFADKNVMALRFFEVYPRLSAKSLLSM